MTLARGGAIGGCFVATLTPFDSAGRLDTGVARAHAQWLVENGVAGLSPAGTTGEFLYLSQQERQALVAAVAEAVHGRATVMAGIWALTAHEAAENAHAAEQAGATAAFLQTPIYYPASDDAIYAWYAEIGAATRLPLYAYNIPQYAANQISPACLERLLNDGIVAGIKDSSGSAERIGMLVERFGARAGVFAASDSFATEGRKLGACGFISAIGNVMPGTFVKLWAGDESLQAQVDGVRKALKQVGSIPALKYLAGKVGFEFGSSRLPGSDLTAEQKSALDGVEV
jgi:dihydrodipicolinate synthase/N-acetylneuraminate lyase